MIEESPLYPKKDEDHLRLLVIFHRIMGIITLVFSSLFILYIYVIKTIFSDPRFLSQLSDNENMPVLPHEFFNILIVVTSVMIILGWTLGILTLISAQFIKNRKNRMFIIIVACINCLIMPVGTALGVFTLIVMFRESVVKIFQNKNLMSAENI